MFYYYFDEGIHEDDIFTAEYLQYDFSTIRSATDNFSSDNKLGQGGFGPVYKVIADLAYLMHKRTL